MLGMVGFSLTLCLYCIAAIVNIGLTDAIGEFIALFIAIGFTTAWVVSYAVANNHV